jgi:hypothetical protein
MSEAANIIIYDSHSNLQKSNFKKQFESQTNINLLNYILLYRKYINGISPGRIAAGFSPVCHGFAVKLMQLCREEN